MSLIEKVRAWFAAGGADGAELRQGGDEYACTSCNATFQRGQVECPDCGGLVVSNERGGEDDPRVPW